MNPYDEYDEATLKHLQRCELIILDDFLHICDEYGLTYFSWGGTAIGALRHSGFIPWDDDIDLCLPSADLDTLIAVVRRDYADKYEIMNAETNINYPLPTTRMMLKGTQFCEETLKDVDCDLGIFLDLYAFDNVSDDEREYKCQAHDAWFNSHARLLLSISDPVILKKGVAGGCIRVACAVASGLLRLLRVSPQKLFEKEREARKRYQNRETSRFAYLCDTSAFGCTYVKDEVFPLRAVEFEGRTLMFPKTIEKQLTDMYGDFMTLPPVESRKNHYPARLDFGPY